GASAEQMREREPEIVEFAGLGAFIDHPVRAYSSGMKSRLAFSIVTSGKFDVLLIDEALSVGDVGFALRCRKRIRTLCRQGATVVSSRHALDGFRARIELVRSDGVLIFRDEKMVSLVVGETPIAISLGPMRLGRFTYRVRLELAAADGSVLARGETAFAVEDH